MQSALLTHSFGGGDASAGGPFGGAPVRAANPRAFGPAGTSGPSATAALRGRVAGVGRRGSAVGNRADGCEAAGVFACPGVSETSRGDGAGRRRVVAGATGAVPRR